MGYERNESTTAAPQPTMAAEAIFAAPPSSRRVCNVAVMVTAGMFVGSAFPLFAAIDAGLRWMGQKSPHAIARELTPLCASVLLFLIMGGVFLACIRLARL